MVELFLFRFDVGAWAQFVDYELICLRWHNNNSRNRCGIERMSKMNKSNIKWIKRNCVPLTTSHHLLHVMYKFQVCFLVYNFNSDTYLTTIKLRRAYRTFKWLKFLFAYINFEFSHFQLNWRTNIEQIGEKYGRLQ